MKEKILIMSILLSLYFLGMFFGYNLKEKEIVIIRFNDTRIIEKQISVEVIKEVEVENKHKFEEVAERMANHSYDLEEYNCVNFSKNLVKALDVYRYDARVVNGIVDCDYFDKSSCYASGSKHAWVIVEIPIEATSGKVIEPDFYYKVYGEWE